MRRRIESILFVLLILVSCSSCYLFSSNRIDYLDFGLRAGGQFINYDDDISYNDRSAFGPGIYASFSSIQDSGNTHLGVSSAYEYHDFSSFNKYHDAKVIAFYRHVFYPHQDPESDFYFYGDIGLGCDHVWRGDGAFAIYFMLHGGTGFFIRYDDRVGTFISIDGQVTFQDGSIVHHLSGVIGTRYRFGGQKR